MNTHEVSCACGRTFHVSPLHPRFPGGPFVCPTCESSGQHAEGDAVRCEGDPAIEIQEASTDAIVLGAKTTF